MTSGHSIVDARVLLVLALLAIPAPAGAQREPFYAAVVGFYRSLGGLHGDEGPELTAQLEAMSTALARWDQRLAQAERDLRSRLHPAADLQSALQVHATLASLYIERGRWDDAIRAFDEDIRLDPRRSAFHRLKGVALETASRATEAAAAFRAAWRLDPGEPQNAYRLIAQASDLAAPEDIEHARATLADLERRLIGQQRSGASQAFTNMRGIIDSAGGGMAFVPAAYAGGFSLILQGQLERGVAELRDALARDPLVADPVLRTEPMVRGVTALRQGRVAAAVTDLETVVAAAADSSEAHRILATAYAVAGDVTASVRHLRDAVRLNPRDERSRLALVRTLMTVDRSAEADAALQAAVADLPESGALRWRLSTRSRMGQDADDRALIEMADRIVLFVGKGDLYRALAGLAQLHLDDARAIGLLEHAVRLAPNSAAAHRALGRVYADNGRADKSYAEFVIALLLEPDDVETLTALGRWHLTAGEPAAAVAALERAVAIAPGDRLAVHALAGALIQAGRVNEGTARLQEAERFQTQAIDDNRTAKRAAVLRLDAEMRLSAADHAGAIDVWRRAIELQPGSPAVHLRLAAAFALSGRHDEAVAEYRTAIALRGGADAHRRLAELYETMGRPDLAVRERVLHTERRLEELRQRAAEGVYGF